MALLVSSVISDCNVPLVHSVLPSLPPCSPASNSFHFSSFKGHKEQRLSLPLPLPLFSSVCVSMCVCVSVFSGCNPRSCCTTLPPPSVWLCRRRRRSVGMLFLSLCLSPLSFAPAAAPYRSILFVFVPLCLHGDVFSSSIRPPVYLRSLDAAREGSQWPVQYSVYGFFFFNEV